MKKQQSPWKVAGGFSTDWEHLTVERQALAPGVTLLHASGGNTLALTGAEGTLLVDPSFAQVAPSLKAALKEMGAAPVRYVVISHYHSDHSGSAGAFAGSLAGPDAVAGPDAGHAATVVGQENCRRRLQAESRNNFWGYTTPAAPGGDWPTLTYDHRLTLYLDGEVIELLHREPAHTDGDTIIFLHHANVVHMGDIYINGLYPYIDLAGGGTIDGYFGVIDEVLARIDDRTRVVPGHGPVATRAELRAYREMLQQIRDRVQHEVEEGKTLEEVIASNPSREFDAQWASDRVGPDGIAGLIYQSLTGKRMDWHPAR